ncbi:hypothetical protein Tco_1269911 [Tanacetum coccineum]
MMTSTKFAIEKFDGKNDFGLWQVRMKALLEQHAAALGELPATTIVVFDNVIQKKSRIDLLVGDLAAIDTAISDEDQAFLLLISLPSSYGNFKKKGDGGEGLYVRRRSGRRDMEQGIITRNLKVNCVRIEDHVSRSGADRRDYLVDLKSMTVVIYCLMMAGMLYTRDRGFYREDVVGQDQGYKGFAGGTMRNKKG